MNKKCRAFTLIELLVVVAIVSLLSSVVFASLGDARIKARNAYKNETMHQYVNAFALFYLTHNSYPSPSSGPEDPINRKCLGGRTTPCGLLVYLGGLLDGGASQTGEQNAQLDAEVATVYPGAPSFDKFVYTYVPDGEIDFAGPEYWCDIYTSGRCMRVNLKWYLEKINQTCFGNAIASNQILATSCFLTLN